ncbi:MAG: DUF4363 family protein [Ruminococcus sp.]
MKRIFAAIVLLCISGLLCFAEYSYVEKSVDKFTGMLDELKAVSQENKDEAIKLAEEINTQWDETVVTIDMLLYHDYIDEIGVSLSTLESYIVYEERAELYATCEAAKKQLLSLKTSELPTAENVI